MRVSWIDYMGKPVKSNMNELMNMLYGKTVRMIVRKIRGHHLPRRLRG